MRLPRDDQLRADLVAPRYAFLIDGRLQVESKNLMRSRGLASPDSADALIHTFAEMGLGIASGMTSRPARRAGHAHGARRGHGGVRP